MRCRSVLGICALGLIPLLALCLVGVAALTAAVSGAAAGTPAGPGQGPAAGSGTPAVPGGLSPSALHAVAFAEAAIGVPYLYGGDGPGGFDCSGLVWAAYSGTPAAFPRMGAAEEFARTPPVPSGSPLLPGDLVFFADAGGIEHVGIFVGDAPSGQPVMVDAPHTGATVRYDTFSAVFGAHWGDEYYTGATRPAA